MQNISLTRLNVSLRRVTRVFVPVCVLGALLVGGALTPTQAAPGHTMSMRSSRVSMSQANRIARQYVGGDARVVRNEGVHGGAYRIHVHRDGIARHVFVGTRSGHVIKTRIINRAADRREDRR